MNLSLFDSRDSFQMIRVILLLLFSGINLYSANTQETERPSLWEAGVMFGGLSYPHFRGSSDREIKVLPFPYLIYRGQFLKSRDGAIHLGTKRGKFRLGLSFFMNPPVEDSPSRIGMEDLGTRLESGPSLIYEQPKSWGENWFALRCRFSTSFDDGSFRYVGNLGEAVIGQTLRKGLSQWKWSWRALYGDTLYHRTLYGVQPHQALNWRPIYTPASGYGGMAVTLSHGRDFNRGRYGVIFIRGDFMNGAIWDESPLVTEKTQFIAGFIFRYRIFSSAKKSRSDKEESWD